MVSQEKLYHFFSQEFELHNSTSDWFRFVNPFDGHDDVAMGVNFRFLWVKDFRTKYSVGIINFCKKYLDKDYHETIRHLEKYKGVALSKTFRKIVIRDKIEMPEHSKSFIFESGVFPTRAVNYLRGRGFDPEQLDALGFRYCDDGRFSGYIIVPFKVNGSLTYYLGRNFLGGEPRYMNPDMTEVNGLGSGSILFNEDAIHYNKTIYVTEGWTDALTIGNRAVALLGSSISSRQQSLFNTAIVNEIYFIADRGFYTEMLKNALSLAFMKIVYVINVDGLNGKDVNEIGREPIMELCSNANPMGVSAIIKELCKS